MKERNGRNEQNRKKRVVPPRRCLVQHKSLFFGLRQRRRILTFFRFVGAGWRRRPRLEGEDRDWLRLVRDCRSCLLVSSYPRIGEFFDACLSLTEHHPPALASLDSTREYIYIYIYIYYIYVYIYLFIFYIRMTANLRETATSAASTSTAKLGRESNTHHQHAGSRVARAFSSSAPPPTASLSPLPPTPYPACHILSRIKKIMFF